MGFLGQAALAARLECLPAAEQDFTRCWYREEHMAERVDPPGDA